MSDMIKEMKQIIEYYDQGDLMSCLSHFEGAMRPIVSEIDTHENQEILDILKQVCIQIDEEDWQASIENLEKVKGILNG